MEDGYIVYVHGRGHDAPRSQTWRQGFSVGLARAGYDISVGQIRSLARAVKYSAYLNPGVKIDSEAVTATAEKMTDRAQAELEIRNEAARSRIGPGLPVGPKSKVIGRVSRQQALVDQVLKQRFADVVRYLDDDPRRGRILREIREQLPTSGRAVVIGHSLGSIIALDLLRVWPGELHIDLLFTLGSPAALPQLQAHLRDCKPYFPADQVGSWINLFDSDDPVTGGSGLEGIYGDLVVDHHVENGGMRDNHGVDRYLEHIAPALLAGPLLAQYLNLDQPAAPKLPADEVQRAAWLDRSLGCRLRNGLVDRAEDQASKSGRFLAREHLRVDANRSFALPAETDLADRLAELAKGQSQDLRLKLLIELRSSHPFAPYELETEGDEIFGEVVAISSELSWPSQLVPDVHHAVRRARSAQDRSNVWGAAAVGGVAVVAAAVATGGVALVAAPGLAGAAAIASGLSGLGSLVGGSMAAGLFVTAGAGAAAPALAFAALQALNPGETLEEVTKIHAEALVHRWQDRAEAHDRVLRDLERLLDQAQRSVRLHRSVEAGLKSSDSTKAWQAKADIIQRALDDLRRDS